MVGVPEGVPARKMFLEILIISLSLACTVIGLILLLSQTPPQTKLVIDKAKPIECGFEDRLKGSRSPFSLYFFILSVLFLVFDVETVLLFPTPLMLNLFQDTTLSLGVFFFLFVLLVGLIHETRQGALKWAQ
jgi:NADH-quinone oxidoreductase subunit A